MGILDDRHSYFKTDQLGNEHSGCLSTKENYCRYRNFPKIKKKTKKVPTFRGQCINFNFTRACYFEYLLVCELANVFVRIEPPG